MLLNSKESINRIERRMYEKRLAGTVQADYFKQRL